METKEDVKPIIAASGQAATTHPPTGKTPGEARAHKRQLELLNEDAKRLCTVDIHTPFRSLQDALDRLLPFHLLAGLRPDAADWEELSGMQSPELILSRSQLHDQQAMASALDAMRKFETYRNRLDAATQKYFALPSQQHVLLPEDRYAISRLLLLEAKDQLEREKRRPAGYRTPDRDAQAGLPEPAEVEIISEGQTTAEAGLGAAGLPQQGGEEVKAIEMATEEEGEEGVGTGVASEEMVEEGSRDVTGEGAEEEEGEEGLSEVDEGEAGADSDDRELMNEGEEDGLGEGEDVDEGLEPDSSDEGELQGAPASSSEDYAEEDNDGDGGAGDGVYAGGAGVEAGEGLYEDDVSEGIEDDDDDDQQAGAGMQMETDEGQEVDDEDE